MKHAWVATLLSGLGFLGFALLGPACLSAEDVAPPEVPAASLDLPALVGLDLAAAFAAFGAPAEVFPHRGAEDWQDDVVFYYDRHLYLFWFRNRVWQARLDERYEGTFLSLEMGLSREEVIARMTGGGPGGGPVAEVAGSLLFDLQDRDYPLRLRLFFTEDRLSDVYCYRSDF